MERQELQISSMLSQLDLNETNLGEEAARSWKPNVIGNAETSEVITAANMNSGKNKKVGLGVYNVETRSNVP